MRNLALSRTPAAGFAWCMRVRRRVVRRDRCGSVATATDGSGNVVQWNDKSGRDLPERPVGYGVATAA